MVCSTVFFDSPYANFTMTCCAIFVPLTSAKDIEQMIFCWPDMMVDIFQQTEQCFDSIPKQGDNS